MRFKLKPQKDLSEWHKRFIILPREVEDCIVFMEYVLAKRVVYDQGHWDDQYTLWEYKLIERNKNETDKRTDY